MIYNEILADGGAVRKYSATLLSQRLNRGKDKDMFNQITIYDLMYKESDDVDINSISEEEMVGIVSRLTGTDFIFSPLFGQWEAVLSKPHGKKLSLHFDNYAIGGKERLISCGYSFKHGGGGSPLDSIDEAVAFFQKKMKTLTSSPLDW